MAFVVMPFIFLSFSDSIRVWQSVYYYGVLAIIASLAFFSSPAKGILIKKLKARGRPNVVRSTSTDSLHEPTLGLPNDAIKEFDEVVQEIKAEIESRRRRGSVVTMPTGAELKAAVEGKIGRKLP
jgi:lysophospholipid acyltransferase